MVVMSVATFANVVARYFFNSPIQWAEELARYSFIWVSSWSRGVHQAKAAHRHRHSAAGASRRPRVTRLLVDCCTVGIALVIAYYGWKLTAAATQITATCRCRTT